MVLLLTSLLLPHPVYAKGYYVSNSGNNNNAGDLPSPFQTIQHCADLVTAGDTCFIRKGTYRETVTPKNSGTSNAPITFTSYQNEQVIITGTEKVTGWTQHSGAIYKTTLNWNLGLGRNQVFINNQMMTEARWPNTSLDVSHPTDATVESGHGEQKTIDGKIYNVDTIVDADLTQLPNEIVGAKINIGLGGDLRTSTGDILESSPGKIVMRSHLWADNQNDSANSMYRPINPDHYFLWGKLAFLDSPSEWFYDSQSQTLYLNPPSGTDLNTTSVEVKKRDTAFNLHSKSYINLKNLSIFAATIVLNDQSNHNEFSHLNLTYISHNQNLPTGILIPKDYEKNPLPETRNWQLSPTDLGIVIRGDSNKLTDSTLAYSATNGIYLTGSNHSISNNIIHDINYAARDFAGIYSLGTTHTFTRNTIYNSAGTILFLFSQNSIVSYNRLYNGGLQLYDWGIIYAKYQANGSQIYNNLIYSHKGRESLANFFPGGGIYLGSMGMGIDAENPFANIQIHHNVIWDVSRGIILYTPINNSVIVYNNTIDSAHSILASKGTVNIKAFSLTNNIMTGSLRNIENSEVVLDSNLTPPTNPLFVNPSARNYQLRNNSPARTGGNTTYATYRGAYDPNVEAWSAGASITNNKPGDLNNDSKVDILDYNILVSHFGNPYTIFDYNDLVTNFGQ